MGFLDFFKNLGNVIKDVVTGNFNDLGKDLASVGNSITECPTTNQGGTMDDIRDQIKNINSTTKSILQSAIDDLNLYVSNLIVEKRVTDNNTDENKYKEIKKANDGKKEANDNQEKKNIDEQKAWSSQVAEKTSTINQLNSTLTGHTNYINDLERNHISPNITGIQNDYSNINSYITKNDKDAILSNNNNIDMQRASFSIAYLEYLLIDAYKQIYRSVYFENVSVSDGLPLRFDNNINQFSINNYQTQRIQFYKDINTFLFYFYYVMIIVLVIVVLKFNSTTLLIKLTLFRVFAILLILYPLFIIHFQNFIYTFFKYLLSKLQ
jgi:hypothetical protein